MAEPRKLFVAPLPNIEEANAVKINKVLVANRGEIACRVIRTCKLLGIVSTAIYVDEDASSLHVTEADESINLGSVASGGTNPYLDIALIVETAKSLGADAIHPGYGYLSENAGFADAVRKAGLIFIGPGRLALTTLGDKRAAKDYLSEHAPNVPLIPGFAGSSQDIRELRQAADEIGYPVMVKAAAGGGGKGLRIAYDAEELKEALARAQSEAQRSFGSSDCILEKYVEAGKHVEMQIMGDQHGFVACFLERDCSVQRRNQKIIEETPCAWLTPDFREKIKETAVRIGELIGYEGAGTVEFIVDVKARKFYFLEVNARLQVEHPITEEVTGFDLVALQIYVAAGGRLADLEPIHSIRQIGHSIECRLCAEDPSNDFAPESGPVHDWHPATGATATRFETAIQSGSEISIYFDPMIAKIIVWAPTRALAIKKAAAVLRDTACVGVRTNQLFMQSCLLHPEFQNLAYTTAFIGTNLDKLLINPYAIQEPRLARVLPVLPVLYQDSLSKKSRLPPSSALHRLPRGFRNQSYDRPHADARIVTTLAGSLPDIPSPALVIRQKSGGSAVTERLVCSALPEVEDAKETRPASSKRRGLGAAEYNAIANASKSGELDAYPAVSVSNVNLKLADQFTDGLTLTVDGLKLHARVQSRSSGDKSEGSEIFCHVPALGTWSSYRCETLLEHFRKSDMVNDELGVEGAESSLRAPMPCRVISVVKADGDKIKAGETLMVIESMKMETNICAPREGIFESLVKAGQ
ncbi:hypothetical protein LTR74_012874 [Friedmanniomyces endolithicus]|nr:hypothetical protein LTR74_012874 [Friedmanniomyces endolithicus]